MRKPLFAWTFLAAMMVVSPGVIFGQSYPSKPIRIIAAEPGGGSDFAARLIAQQLTGSLGQPVIVENRASGIVQGEIVAKAPPDGYTLLLNSGSLWIGQLMQDKAPYDVIRDFSPITLAAISPSILAVHPSLPVRSVKELIALARARPGELNYSSGSGASTGYFATEFFKAMTNVNIVNVPYRGNGPALNALIAGEVQLAFSTAGGVAPHVKSKRLIALAVTSANPSALFPGLPSIAASGVPGYESVVMVGVFAPAATPETIINRLNQESVKILNQASVKERFLNAGVEIIGSSPEELGSKIKAEMARMRKVIIDTGIRK